MSVSNRTSTQTERYRFQVCSHWCVLLTQCSGGESRNQGRRQRFFFWFWPGQNFFHPWVRKAFGNKCSLHILCNLISWGLHSGHALTEAENNFLCTHSSHCLDQSWVPSKHASREFVLLNQRHYLPSWDGTEKDGSRDKEQIHGSAPREKKPEKKVYYQKGKLIAPHLCPSKFKVQ